MAIDVLTADRAASPDRREASRAAAHQYLALRAAARRDTRIEQAKASAATRAKSADCASQNPARIIDVLA